MAKEASCCHKLEKVQVKDGAFSPCGWREQEPWESLLLKRSSLRPSCFDKIQTGRAFGDINRLDFMFSGRDWRLLAWFLVRIDNSREAAYVPNLHGDAFIMSGMQLCM